MQQQGIYSSDDTDKPAVVIFPDGSIGLRDEPNPELVEALVAMDAAKREQFQRGRLVLPDQGNTRH